MSFRQSCFNTYASELLGTDSEYALVNKNLI
jgi:hypothetical protein